MKQRHTMALSLLLASGMTACNGNSGSLPAGIRSNVFSSRVASNSSVRNLSGARLAVSDAATAYTYTAPWGGFGTTGHIYVLPQGACSYIPASQANGYTWPAFLNTVASGTKVTITGVPSYNNPWSQTNNCPTGGIVATNVTLGAATSSPTPVPSPVAAGSFLIDAGGGATQNWMADSFAYGGLSALTTASVNTSKVVSPAPEAVYKTNRWGSSFMYVVPGLTARAGYTVRLHFAETYFNSPGRRVFQAAINGTQIFTNFDIFQAAGGANVAIVKQYTVLADATGKISIAFTSIVNNALVSGIELQNISSGPLPLPTATPTPPGGVLNYPNPFPQWRNALALKVTIDPSKAIAHIKSYDAAAASFYQTYNPSWSQQNGGVAGWDPKDQYVPTSGGGSGFYVASMTDPTYKLYCGGSSNCYGGYSHNITNMHIPSGARTQGSGQGCDCHLYVLEPVGWKPTSDVGFAWPDVSPYQYEIDVENAATDNNCGASGGPNPSSLYCTTFNSGGSIFGGNAVFSTGSTGWYGGGTASINNGFAPANPAPGEYTGSADKSNTPYTTLTITAQDYLQGAINHETSLAVVCAEASQSDNWPASRQGTSDYSCHDPGTDGYHRNFHATGWSYGDHLWLERSDSQIANDLLAKTLSPMQAVYATSLAHYGAVIFDVITPWGPTFNTNSTTGDPMWNQVAAKYHLPRINESYPAPTTGYMYNIGLPVPYMKYLHAVDSCVVEKTC